MLPVEERVRSYRPEVIPDLSSDAECSTGKDPGNRTLEPAMAVIQDRKAVLKMARETARRAKAKEFMRQQEKREEEGKQREEAEFSSMLNDVLNGIHNDTGVMGDTQ
eukprot:gene23152-30357_t